MNYGHLDAPELRYIFGTGPMVLNVVYVEVSLALLGNRVMVNGFMPSVQRLNFCLNC